MPDKVKVNIYGDSLMRGTVVDENNRYHSTVQPILEQLDDGFGIVFCNRARFGITVDKGAQLLERDLRNGLDCEYAVIEFGGNDCSFLWDEVAAAPEKDHQPFTLLEHFRDTLAGMVQKLQKVDVKPILVTLPPIDAVKHLLHVGKTDEDRKSILQWLGDVQVIYRFHEMYSKAVERIAEDTRSILVDVRGRFLPRHDMKQLVGQDGVHPSPAGYELFLHAFADFISAHRRGSMRLVYE